jgi:hypothetical protein
VVAAPGPPCAERLAAPLPDQSLERVLGIDAQKPGDGEDQVDHQHHRDEAGHQCEQRHPEEGGTHRQTGEEEHQKAARRNVAE